MAPWRAEFVFLLLRCGLVFYPPTIWSMCPLRKWTFIPHLCIYWDFQCPKMWLLMARTYCHFCRDILTRIFRTPFYSIIVALICMGCDGLKIQIMFGRCTFTRPNTNQTRKSVHLFACAMDNMWCTMINHWCITLPLIFRSNILWMQAIPHTKWWSHRHRKPSRCTVKLCLRCLHSFR